MYPDSDTGCKKAVVTCYVKASEVYCHFNNILWIQYSMWLNKTMFLQEPGATHSTGLDKAAANMQGASPLPIDFITSNSGSAIGAYLIACLYVCVLDAIV